LAVEANAVDANIAALLAPLRRHLEGDLFGATTLLILHDGATSRAECGMFAGRTIRHAEEEVEIGVERDGYLHFGDGEVLVTARDLGNNFAVLGDGALNTLVLEVGTGLERTFAWSERIPAGEAGEGEATEAVEVACCKTAPVKASFLLGCADIVGIKWVIELLSIAPSCGSSLLQ
jgi:hypothetical protein